MIKAVVFNVRNPTLCIVLYFSPFLCSLEPIIRFFETKFSVSEPKEAGALATVRVPVVRVGDTSKVSVVRVHTKDGSAISGEDYYPVSQGKPYTHPLFYGSHVKCMSYHIKQHPMIHCLYSCWPADIHLIDVC